MSNHKKHFSGGNEFLNAHELLKYKLGVCAGSELADLGCGGSGYFVFEAARLVGKKGTVYAVDILKLVLKNIEHRAEMLGYDNIKTVWSNLEEIGATKINNSSLDFALLINILFQNKEHGKIIREAARMLKRGGKLLIIDWQAGYLSFGPPPEMKLKPEVLTDLALGAGLKRLEFFEAGEYHFGIIFEKI
jgi:ubiquinone/menaquinone biosynthesis C-methylase UbiE